MTAKRILVIDDSDLILRVAKIGLGKVKSWEVLTANSGDDGLAKAEAEQPDAILLDVVMPGLDGPATFQALRANRATRQIPVVMVTGADQAADRERFAELGVRTVIGKPFDPLKLASQVAGALGWDL